MRCYACDKDLPDSVPPDSATTRWYCIECFEPTMELQLAQISKEIQWGLAFVNPDTPVVNEEMPDEDIEIAVKEIWQREKFHVFPDDEIEDWSQELVVDKN